MNAGHWGQSGAVSARLSPFVSPQWSDRVVSRLRARLGDAAPDLAAIEQSNRNPALPSSPAASHPLEYDSVRDR